MLLLKTGVKDVPLKAMNKCFRDKKIGMLSWLKDIYLFKNLDKRWIMGECLITIQFIYSS